MAKKTFPITIISIIAAVAFSACTVENADDKLILPGDENGEEVSEMTLADSEFVFNYALLGLYYIHAEKELGDIEDYYHKKPVNENTDPFVDTYYMYNNMTDSYTSYFSPEYFYQIYQSLTYSPKESGIGALAKSVSDSAVIISQVYTRGPAETSGLQQGDTVLSIDGTPIYNTTAFKKLTSGEYGETISMEVQRDSSKLDIDITLSTYITPTILVDYVDSIPVISISEFTDTTTSDSGSYGELINALEKIKKEKAVVIDLSNNPGGSTDQCINMASEFLAKGDTIIIERYASDEDSVNFEQIIDTISWTASSEGIAKDKYVVLVQNGMSGSCSEIFAAALGTSKKSPIVGSTSYGKGIGQYYIETYAQGFARITSMQFFDKDMNSYHKVGILPDYEIEDRDSAITKAVELAKESKEKRKAGYDTTDKGHFIDKDPSLAKTGSSKASLDKGAFRIKRTKK